MTRAYLTVALGIMAAGYLLFAGCQVVAGYTDRWLVAPEFGANAASGTALPGEARAGNRLGPDGRVSTFAGEAR